MEHDETKCTNVAGEIFGIDTVALPLVLADDVSAGIGPPTSTESTASVEGRCFGGFQLLAGHLLMNCDSSALTHTISISDQKAM